jgi:predicted amidohydrolase
MLPLPSKKLPPTQMMTFDLVIRGGRVIDPANGLDQTTDIAFKAGKVAAIGSDADGSASEVIHAEGLLVTPGLIDLHRIISKDHTKSLDPARASAQKSDAEALALPAI